jgi:uncharacterized protein
MLIESEFDVPAPSGVLLVRLLDPGFTAACLPGCEELERVDDNRYRVVVVIAMAGIRARFNLVVEITARDDANVWAVTRGEEGGQSSTLQADSHVRLQAVDAGTRVSYRTEVNVAGRLGRFALGMMKKKAQSLGDEFAANLSRRLQAAGDAAPAPAASAATWGESSVRAPASTPPPSGAGQ